MWTQEIETLKQIIARTGLEETVKWGVPTFTYNGKNVAGIAGFKNHLALWFYNGVFLKDAQGVLINAQEGKTKALRQWRFFKGDLFDEKLITAYLLEAIENEKQGRVWKPEKQAPEPVPERLQAALDKHPKLAKAFAELPPYKQKEYTEYIATAKREQTLQSRLEKILPLIEQGVGLNDKYRK